MLVPLAGALRAFLALVAALAMTATSSAPGTAPRASTTSSGVSASARTTTSAGRSAVSSTAAPASSATTLGPVVRGQATHYGPAAPGGNCMFPTVPADKLTVAAGPDLYAGAAGCGGYLTVTSGRRTIRVKIDNQCPECGHGHIDLSDEAFAALAPLGRGLIPITYRIVTNPRLSRGLSFVVKSGSSRYWLALLVDNTGNRLRSVEVQTSGAWRALSRADYGYWVADSGVGSGPFVVRITDVAGHRAVVGGIRLTPGAIQQTAARLYH